ncbi:YciI family protein [Microbulbifer sp. JMSA004]|uniref:YciI family protein n=1 Tax=unclassified Microbulbifer TaxID=2619833 RepID=UPI0024ADB8E9|nr:YciI family protein [Microbulbifer sp. VAAF005]WHI48574.1 YciI family protein [Microbulbifer sp. VAAF005]
MFIVSLTYIKPLEEVDKFISEHIEFLNKYYDLGYFQLSGRKEPRTGGVILVTIDSRSSLDQILKQDPFYREGLANYDMIQIIPTKSSRELEFLISA